MEGKKNLKEHSHSHTLMDLSGKLLLKDIFTRSHRGDWDQTAVLLIGGQPTLFLYLDLFQVI